jgi:hypothetical protein
MPLPQQPYSPIAYSDKVRNTNPVGSWGQIHPTTQKYLVENYGVNPTGANWMQQPSNLRDAVARYPLATVKGMAAQGRFGKTINPQTAVPSINAASLAGSLAGTMAGGISGLPLTSMSGVKVNPVKGGATVDLNKGTVTRNNPMGKQGSSLSDKQVFKLAFIAKCIEDGLTVEQMCERVKQALHTVEKKAGATHKSASILGSALGGISGGLLGTGALAVGLPLALGYYGIGPASYNMFSKPNLPSREDLLKEELMSEYQRQADILRKNTELAKRRKERSKNISGVTRF